MNNIKTLSTITGALAIINFLFIAYLLNKYGLFELSLDYIVAIVVMFINITIATVHTLIALTIPRSNIIQWFSK